MGVPGVALAGLLTIVVVSSGAVRRRREQALLRLRGASSSALVQFTVVEALLVGAIGTAAGLAVSLAIVRSSFGRWSLGATRNLALEWIAITAAAGIVISTLAVLVPTLLDLRNTSVVGSRQTVRRSRAPLWERFGLDLVLLGLSAAALWLTARNGYQIIVAPEGSSRLSLSYSAFLPVLLFWVSGSLLVVRLSGLAVIPGRRYLRALLRPVAGPLSTLVTSSMSRQRLLLGVGVLVVALGLAFAVSTSVFNSTYAAQARVDAELTNGADVTVSIAGGDLTSQLDVIAAQPGVQAAEPLQHRFAYVGADLQDLYGIRPVTLGSAAALSDAFFATSSAADAMRALSDTPNGILVSAETVRDFQLQPGDTLRLRLQSAKDHQYHVVPFVFVGIVREFPTAPKDSFLVANASYIAEQTQSASIETVLIKTNASPPDVAASVRQVVEKTAGASVRDIVEQRRITNTGLTAISVTGLTRIEMVFAVLLAAAGSSLVLALGIQERRRNYAIASALGARRSQLGAFVWSETGLMLVGGGAAGAVLGWVLSWMLVKVLTGVFDPPPTHLSVPWVYIGATLLATAVPLVAVSAFMMQLASRARLQVLREL